MKKRSPETQLRLERRENRELRRLYSETYQLLFHLKGAGASCANVCYNLSQRDLLPQHERETLRRAYLTWDEWAAKAKVLKEK